jgi:hypothetical protein
MKRSLYRIGYNAAISERHKLREQAARAAERHADRLAQALRVIARMRIMDSVSAIRMRAIAAAELFPEETRR